MNSFYKIKKNNQKIDTIYPCEIEQKIGLKKNLEHPS